MAKLVTRLEALGSAIMRRTCFSIAVCPSAPGLVNPPAAASVSSSSSGPVFHRKKERREASSRSVRATSFCWWERILRTTPLSRIGRYRNSGLASTAATTCSIP